MRTLFRNIGELYTFQGFADRNGRKVSENDYGLIKKAAMLVENGRILWLGEEKKLPRDLKKKKVKDVNLRGLLVQPSLVECHTHLIFAGDRTEEFELRNTGVSYQEIAKRGGGILSTMKATREASVKTLTDLAQERVDRYVEQGVTVIESKSGYALNLEGELKCLSVNKKLKKARIVSTFLGAHAKPPEFSTHEEYLEFVTAKVLPVVKQKKLADRTDIFIEKGFFEGESAKKYLQACRDLGFSITIHADQLSLSGGTEFGLEVNAQSVDHGVHMSDALITRLANSKTVAVLLPVADLYLKCPYPPARKLWEAGARVALATDYNPGSSPSQDVQLTGLLARLEMKMSLPEVFSAYTLGAATALGLQAEIGSLSVGKMADFLVSDRALSEWFISPGRRLPLQVFAQGEQIHSA